MLERIMIFSIFLRKLSDMVVVEALLVMTSSWSKRLAPTVSRMGSQFVGRSTLSKPSHL
jgi:hypothetical protein